MNRQDAKDAKRRDDITAEDAEDAETRIEERSVMALRGDDRDENRPSCRPTREHRAIFGRRE